MPADDAAVRIRVRLPLGVVDELKQLATKRESTVSAVVTELLSEKVEQVRRRGY